MINQLIDQQKVIGNHPLFWQASYMCEFAAFLRHVW